MPDLETPMPTPANYPVWGMQPQARSARSPARASEPPIQTPAESDTTPLPPWLLVAFALVMAAIAYVATRILIGT